MRKIRKLPKLRLKRINHFPGLALAICLLALSTYLLGWSTLFAARAVVIDGTERTAEVNSQIVAASSTFHLGEPLARVDVHSLSRRISLLDWVEKLSVKRDWIHGQIHIVIQERTPIAQFIDGAGQNQLIDKSGVIFLAHGNGSYPVITFKASGKSSDKSSSKDLIDAAATYIQELPSDLLDNAQSFIVNSIDSIQSTHTGLGSGEVVVRWGNNSEIATKVKVLRALLVLPENSKAHLFDLSSPLSPIVK